MNFEVDKQTKNDLNIFSKFKGELSIFDYYNYTTTTGGKNLLELFFDSPINDKHELNNRISTIRFFRESNVKFQLEKGNLDFIEHYLNLNIPVLNSNVLDSIVAWSSNFFKPNNNYYLISKGLHCLKRHIQNLILSLKSIENNCIPEFVLQLKKEFEKLQEIPEFQSFLNSKDNKFSMREINRFDTLIRKQEKNRIIELLHFTYLLDVYISVAESARINGFSFPTIHDTAEPELKIYGFFHPFLKKNVLNDFEIHGKQKLCFVSGANMAGKSTFLKSVGLCLYLSHIGFPVPATTMETSLFNGICSTINISDDLSKGYSHFYSEVRRIRDIVLMIKKKKKVLVIFDELFRGTNVKDAFDATLLVLSGFTKIKTALFFISTHIVEVGKELEDCENISFKCFASRLEDGKPVYDYKLIDGISSERHGLTIIKNEKIMELIDHIILEN